jgi:hypothetical protein
MDTLVPTGPLVGVNELIVGGKVTVNEDELVAVPPGVVTLIGPLVAPVGTCAVMSVDEMTAKLVSVAPLNLTLVAPMKPVPWMSTLVPTGPLVGVNELIAGAVLHGPVNEDELVLVPPGVPTVIGPAVAAFGTIAWISESEAMVKVAGELPYQALLKVTLVAPVKFEPKMSTVAPAGPQVGVNELIVGGTPNEGALMAVPVGVVTEIGPVAAPAGTVAWISVSESRVKLAATPLKVTSLAPVKFTPEMSTLVPGSPLDGENDLIVGVVTTASSTSRSSKFPATLQPAA